MCIDGRFSKIQSHIYHIFHKRLQLLISPFPFYRYKCPFLKGSIDVLIDKHSKIEELMAKDLENWLGNLYFEVIRMPR